ncbi:MAG: hypothetical protein ACREON_18700 [Gemmatimonadaceae bacterium]
MGSFFESVFEFLFKYRPVVFERGDLVFSPPWPAYVAALAGLVLLVPAMLSYARARGRSTRRDRIVLGALRAVALALVVFCLLRPTMVLSSAVPQRNVLGIVIDDSRSMRIADAGDATRGEAARSLFVGRDSALVEELSRRFLLRFFRFSELGQRIANPSELTFSGTPTDIGRALLDAREELSAVPLSALVLVSDGGDNARRAERAPALEDALLSLRTRRVPVFTVGVGREELPRDIEVSRVEAPRSVLRGATMAVDVMLVQRGFAGKTVQLVVEDSGRIVLTRDVKLRGDGENTPVRLHVPAAGAGARPLRFKVAPQPGEAVAENNEQQVLVTVSDRKEKVLYVEGEPRFELKFIRRAVAGDENLQVVSLQRTADNKFLRLSVDDSLELLGGFPKTREELFSYRGIVLGSIEASFFSVEQLRMLADFVGERGGGLLVLGGRRSLAEGGYAGTPLAEVLPVVLDADIAPDSTADNFSELKVELTPAGARHAALQVAGREDSSAARWQTLPPLSSVNRVRRVKPGATALLAGKSADGAERRVVLAHQRYGRGKAIALPVQDSWMWQMHADVALEDQTHETFWRQMLRWLVSDVPDRVNVVASSDRVEVGDAVSLRSEISDPAFQRLNNVQVTARVTSPSGAVSDVPLEWSVDADGEYEARLPAPERGLYEIRVEARRGGGSGGGGGEGRSVGSGEGGGGELLSSEVAFVQAGDLNTEFIGAGMRAPVLRRIAEETGGRFYTPATVSALPKDIIYTESGTTVMEQKDLWDMPVVFLLLLGLVAGEWGYRRARGLA